MALSPSSLFSAGMGLYAQGEAFLGPSAMQSLVIASGIVIYALLVGNFYHTLSRKEIFRMPRRVLAGEELPPGALDYLSLLVKYTLFFPALALLWTSFLAVSLIIMSEHPAALVASISLAVVVATRILAYADQRISEEVAKLLPVVLLGLVLADPGVFSPGALLARLQELAGMAWRLLPAFGFLVGLEWMLRLLLSIKRMLFPHPAESSGDSDLDHLLKAYRPPKGEDED